MEIKLIRDIKTPDFTLGKFFIDGVQEYFTCEDAIRAVKIQNQTAISAGRYQIIINYSPHFERDMPLLLDVPNFDGVRIHWGNDSGDTDGCILIGLSRIANGVAASRIAFNYFFPKLQEALKTAKVWITIQ